MPLQKNDCVRRAGDEEGSVCPIGFVTFGDTPSASRWSTPATSPCAAKFMMRSVMVRGKFGELARRGVDDDRGLASGVG